MDNRQQRTMHSFVHVLVFLERHPVSPTPPLLAGMRNALDATVARLEKLSGAQHHSRGMVGARVDQRRLALRRERMMPLVRIAKPLLNFAPGAEAALRVPHARADARTVAAAALRMADALEPHKKLLIAAGCSADFLKEIRHEARELALAAKLNRESRERLSTTTAAIASELKKGMKTVQVIEGMVMLHFGKEPGTIRLWRNRRRITARIGRPKKSRKPPPVS